MRRGAQIGVIAVRRRHVFGRPPALEVEYRSEEDREHALAWFEDALKSTLPERHGPGKLPGENRPKESDG